MFSLVWLAGCGRDPEATHVEPLEVLAGETLRVVGRDLAESSLRLGDRELDVEDRQQTALVARVPADASPGRYPIVLVDPAGEHATPVVITVLADLACTGEFRSNTRISVARRTVDLDRFWPDGRRQSWTLAAADVARVEVERSPMADGRTCSAIYLRRVAGGRLLYDDDVAADLTERAHTIAEMLDLPVGRPPR